VKIAIFLALYRGLVEEGDIVIFLSGLPSSGTMDTLFVTQVGREIDLITSAQDMKKLPQDIRPEVLDRIMDLAAELGSEGREGKPVGALFVLGDTDKVASLSRQLILNPFRGYPREERNILAEALEETVKELATIDGAFLVRGNGVMETCGAFLKTASQEEFELPLGLGARHHAAAAITAVTESIAITVSESTGTVTVFRGGKVILTLDKPYKGGEAGRRKPKGSQ
jgi:DNA integrity scanning protein DisA with diadenylate cyclase activity